MFSERLKSLRIEKDLLQKDISNILNISTSAYAFYEQNKREPDYKTLTKLANFLNASIDYLLGKSDIKNPYNDEIISKVPKKFTDTAAGTDGNGNVQIKKIAYV